MHDQYVAIPTSEVAMRDKEIERLEKELAGHRKALNAAKMIIKAKEAIQAITSVDQCHLDEALNTLQSERDANALLTQELAESQAREAKLREYLYSIESSDIGPGQMSVIAKDALALPTDDAALMEALKAERERLLELCKCHEYCSDLADTIRAMED